MLMLIYVLTQILIYICSQWVPTLEFTTHIWAQPKLQTEENWLRFRFCTEYMTNGLLQEDGELWDVHDDVLLATSRQIARFLVPRTGSSGTSKQSS